MLNGSKLTSDLLEDLIHIHVKSMSLYEILKNKGYTNQEYPVSYIDRLSIKYKIISYFHKAKMKTSKNTLSKGGIMVYFDIYNCDVFVYGKHTCVFGKHAIDEGILDYIQQLERELKLKRLLHEK